MKPIIIGTLLVLLIYGSVRAIGRPEVEVARKRSDPDQVERIRIPTDINGDATFCIAYPSADDVCLPLSTLREGMEQ